LLVGRLAPSRIRSSSASGEGAPPPAPSGPTGFARAAASLRSSDRRRSHAPVGSRRQSYGNPGATTSRT
jgi:hypothetical protein